MNDHMRGVNIDVNAIYLTAYFVAGFTWIYALVHGFLDELLGIDVIDYGIPYD